MVRDVLEIVSRIIDGDLPPEALPWLQVGFQRYMRGEAPLEVCLRLTGANRIRARNTALLRAAAILDDDRGLSPWKLAGELAQAIRRFQSVRCVTENLSPLNASLQSAFAAGAKPLRARERLYDLLRGTDKLPMNCQYESGSMKLCSTNQE